MINEGTIWLDSARPSNQGPSALGDDWRLKNYFLLSDVYYKGRPIVPQLMVPDSNSAYLNLSGNQQLDLSSPHAFDRYLPMQHLDAKRLCLVGPTLTVNQNIGLGIDVLKQEQLLMDQKKVLLIDRHDANIMVAFDQEKDEYYPIQVDTEFIFDIQSNQILGPDSEDGELFRVDFDGKREKAEFYVCKYVARNISEALEKKLAAKHFLLFDYLTIRDIISQLAKFREKKDHYLKISDLLALLNSIKSNLENSGLKTFFNQF